MRHGARAHAGAEIIPEHGDCGPAAELAKNESVIGDASQPASKIFASAGARPHLKAPVTRNAQILSLALQQRSLLIEGLLDDQPFDATSEPGSISAELTTVIEASDALIEACEALLRLSC